MERDRHLQKVIHPIHRQVLKRGGRNHPLEMSLSLQREFSKGHGSKTALHSTGTLTHFWMLLFLSGITVLQLSYSNNKPAHLFYHLSAICLVFYGKWNCIKIKLKESEHILFPWFALTFQPIKLFLILVKNLKTNRKYPPLGTVGNSLCGIDWLAFTLLETNPV